LKSNQSAFIFLTSASIIYLLASYGANVWLGRHLGPHEFGNYGVVISIITIINLVQSSGIPQSASRMISKKPLDSHQILNNAFTLQMLSAITLSLLLIIFARPLATLFKDSSLYDLIRLSAITLPFYGIYSIYYGYYNGLHLFKQQAVINISYSIGKISGIVILAYLYGLKGAIIGFALSSVFTFAFIRGGFPKIVLNSNGAELLKYSLPLIGSAAGLTLFLTLDLLFIKGLLNSSKLAGFYSAAQNIAIIPFLGLSAFSSMIFPTISKKIEEGNLVGTQKSIESSLRYLLILLLPLASLIIGNSNNIIDLFYGQAYISASHALVWLTCAYALLTVFSFLANVLNGSGNAQFSWIFAAVGILFASISYLILIPLYDLVGAAIGTGIGSIFATLFTYFYVYKFFKVSIPIITILKLAIASLIIILLSILAQVSGPLLILWFVFMSIIYFVLLIWTNVINRDDLAYLKNLLPDWLPFVKGI
jgi:stage V sporulation protein B